MCRILQVFALVCGLTASFAAADGLEGLEDYARIAEQMSPSFVVVEYELQLDKGEEPSGHRASGLIRDERPLEHSGLLISPTMVIAPDEAPESRFIKAIFARFGDNRVSAVVHSYAIMQNVVFLELAEPLPGTQPIRFNRDAKPPFMQLLHTVGVETRLQVSPFGFAFQARDGGRNFIRSGATGCGAPSGAQVVIDSEGSVAAVLSQGSVALSSDWRNFPGEWSRYSAAELDALQGELENRFKAGILRVRLNFRSPRVQSQMERWARSHYEDEDATEVYRLGAMIDERHILINANLVPKTTARLENITVMLDDGEQVEAQFKASLKDYGMMLATLNEPLAGALQFYSDDLLKLEDKLLLAVEVNLHGEQLVAHYRHDRIGSFSYGRRRQLIPSISGSQESSLLFTVDGKLIAAPIERRRSPSADRYYGSRSGLLPLLYVNEALADLDNNIDHSNIPLSEEDENRLAWLGVELQELGRELARASNVAHLTQDGSSGAMIAYVYPDSPAEKAGIEPGWILLRLHSDSLPKPLDVKLEDRYYWSHQPFPWDQLDDVPEQYYDQIPMPWSSVENSFNRNLTDMGFGKTITAELFWDGEIILKEFEVVQGPPHYEAAPRHNAESFGVTVRNMTYEVQRYFQRKPEDPGVIVSRVETGSRASVAGIKPFEIITHVNDQPVNNVGDFESAIADQDNLRLSVRRMTRGRQVRMRLRQRVQEEDAAADEVENDEE